MSSITGHASLGDPKYGGALFVLPREIRDKIYGLLFKGRYRAAWIAQPLHTELRIPNYDQSDFSILRLSKTIGSEATETLYSENVFRFIMSERPEHYVIKPDFDCLKGVVPLIKNVILDVDTYTLNAADCLYEPNRNCPMRILEGIDVRRQSLHVRMLGCREILLEGSTLASFCHRLKTFVGFRAVTVEILPRHWLLKLDYQSGDDFMCGRESETLMSRFILAVAEELEPAFGPAVSGFKYDTGNTCIPNPSLSSFSGFRQVGFLSFHPGRHSVRKDAADEQG